MVLIISGTDRANSNSAKVARYVHGLFQKNGTAAEVLDLADLKLAGHNGPHYGLMSAPEALSAAVAKVNKADGLYFVVPEYNGSLPGALKYFIDHWKYPDSFEFRPMAIAGLGNTFGGLRPVEHLQGILGYRNAFVYPERIFVHNVIGMMKGKNDFDDAQLVPMFEKQVTGFCAFIKALQNAKLDANSRAR